MKCLVLRDKKFRAKIAQHDLSYYVKTCVRKNKKVYGTVRFKSVAVWTKKYKNRCWETGRSAGLVSFLKLSRIAFLRHNRQLVLFGK